MNDFWSENVQGVMTLYLSRKLRFDDQFFEQYRKAFGLDENADLKILEIGCGPGALAESLHRWYPKAQKATAAVNSKYDERIRLYREGIRQWDTSVSVTMIVRGRKRP